MSVFNYDRDQVNGKGALIYQVFSTSTSSDYVERTTSITVNTIHTIDFQFPITTNSNNIKKLAQNAKLYAPDGCKVKESLSWRETFTNWIHFLSPNIEPGCQEYYSPLQPVIIEVKITNATVHAIKIPGIGMLQGGELVDILNSRIEYREIDKVKIHVLEDPMHQTTTQYYRTELQKVMRHVNDIYLKQTGHLKPAEVIAEVASPNVTFRNIDVTLYHAPMSTYAKHDYGAMLDIVGDRFDRNAINLILTGHLDAGSASPGGILAGRTHCNKCGPIFIPVINSLDPYNGKEFILIAYEDVLNTNDEEYRAGVTVAHEFGHFFNLRHPFGSSHCEDGDGIVDTPIAAVPLWRYRERSNDFNCNHPPTCNGQRRQVENIMDYGPCTWMFTVGQEAVMHDMVDQRRANLFTRRFYQANHYADGVTLNMSVTDLRNLAARPAKATWVDESDESNAEFVNVIFPNPVSSRLNLNLDAPAASQVQLQLIDLRGQLVREDVKLLKQGANKVQWDVSGVAKGTYLIKVKGIGTDISQAIIIE